MDISGVHANPLIGGNFLKLSGLNVQLALVMHHSQDFQIHDNVMMLFFQRFWPHCLLQCTVDLEGPDPPLTRQQLLVNLLLLECASRIMELPNWNNQRINQPIYAFCEWFQFAGIFALAGMSFNIRETPHALHFWLSLDPPMVLPMFTFVVNFIQTLKGFLHSFRCTIARMSPNL